ncbi:MATE family efflux transporter [Eisenbergiella sp.]
MENNNLEREITIGSLLKFTLPTIIVMIFSTLYGMVDGVFVARLINTDALSSVNIVMPLITVATSLGMMFATGGSAIAAKLIGENQTKEARQTFSLMVAATFVTGLVIAILGIVFIEPLLTLLGATKDIYSYCHDYAYFILLLLPASMTSMIFQVFFITAGKATLGMMINIISGISNIVFDYIFIKYCGWGIAGAAIATSMGFAITTIAGLIYFTVNRKNALYLTKPKVNGKVLLHSCTNGASEMVSNLSQGVTLILYNNVIIRIAGVDGVAAITILLYVTDLLIAIFIGYATGISPLISYNYGKNEHSRLKKIHNISLKSICFFSIVVFLIGQLTAGNLVSIFSPVGTNVYDLAVQGFRLFGFAFLFMGISIYGSAMFTAYSDGKVSAIISALRTFVFIIAAVLMLSIIWGLNGVWLSLPVAELLGMLVTVYFFRKYRNKYNYA